MFIWGLVLLGLGILAFLDSQFNFGYIFRSANSFVFMLLSLGILIRTRSQEKLGHKENLRTRNLELKAKDKNLESSGDSEENMKAEQEAVAQ